MHNTKEFKIKLNENEIKNIDIFERWNNVKHKIPQKEEWICVGEIKNKELYEEYEYIDFGLENDCQHCDHYFYTVIGKYRDVDEWETIYVIDDIIESDGEWAKRFREHSELCYEELIKYDIEWNMNLLKKLEELR